MPHGFRLPPGLRLSGGAAERATVGLPSQGLFDVSAIDAGSDDDLDAAMERTARGGFDSRYGRNTGVRGRLSELSTGRGCYGSLLGHGPPARVGAPSCAVSGLFHKRRL